VCEIRGGSEGAGHYLLLRLGDLTREELRLRCASDEVFEGREKLLRARRVLEVEIVREPRLIAVEDAARYRDAVGVALPARLPAAFLEPAPDAPVDLVWGFARTAGPVKAGVCGRRFGLPVGW
jgi:ATP-dependent Lhr-like helicase